MRLRAGQKDIRWMKDSVEIDGKVSGMKDLMRSKDDVSWGSRGSKWES